ncbi:MAG: roadblock/LC7 domain-containing protein, partial [Nitrospirota bacterium]
NIHISLIGDRIILVVIFDKRSSLGLVRLRVKKSSEAFTQIFAKIFKKVEKEKVVKETARSPFAEITEEDIDKLFS